MTVGLIAQAQLPCVHTSTVPLPVIYISTEPKYNIVHVLVIIHPDNLGFMQLKKMTMSY